MKKLLLLTLFISNKCFGLTYPIQEDFNNKLNWTFSGASGIQNYGGAENYATFNIGSTPYPNNTTITITSPIYNFTTSCSSNLTITFPISGVIEDGFDFMTFQYFNSGSWITKATFTGIQGSTLSYSIPNTVTQFRFKLVSDCSVNGYKGGAFNPCSMTVSTCFPANGNCNGIINIYYYDITYFKIDCSSPLPIELISFDCFTQDNYIGLNWITASENNNWYYTIQRSNDTFNWLKIGQIQANNYPSSYFYYDYFPFIGNNYYNLTQTDFDGNSQSFNIVECEVNNRNEYKIEYYNLLGQIVKYNSDLPNGIYFKKTINGKYTKTEKIYK